MRSDIPPAVITIVSRVLEQRFTASGIEKLLRYAGAPGDPPTGSKFVMTQSWLRSLNTDGTIDGFKVLGKVLEELMDTSDLPDDQDLYREGQEAINAVLQKNGLKYIRGGRVVGGLGTPSRSLQNLISERDLAAIDIEFERALNTIRDSPRDAISAASNILELTCKIVLEHEGLVMPAKQDLQPVWNLLRKHFGIDPSVVEDQDLQKIITGLCSVVDGVGALRTHASTAHGNSHKRYNIEPRHARLAVHSAHTITMFILETWFRRRDSIQNHEAEEVRNNI